jgi:biopolymer transport protein ExbB/TolQ
LDPNEGQIYTEPIKVEDHAYELEKIYKLTSRQQDYINPIADKNLSWRSDNAFSSYLEEALENWQNKMYEVSTRRCARLTQEVHWISTIVSNFPTFDGLNHLEAFLMNFEEIVQHKKYCWQWMRP